MNKLDQIYFKTFDQIKGTFDYIVIGAGAYGTSFTSKILELDKNARVLIIEKGSYLIPEHIQNLPPAYVRLNQEAGTSPWQNTGQKGLHFMPQMPYVGGRALFWNAWIPQPNLEELIDWPQNAIDNIRSYWNETGDFVGRRYSLTAPGNDNQDLTGFARNILFNGLDKVDTSFMLTSPSELDSAMATGQGTNSNEFAKFAPIQVLISNLQKYSDRLEVVVDTEVLRLNESASKISSIDTSNGEIRVNSAKILLACNTLEAAFIGSRSFPDNKLIGMNLSGHMRSWIAARIPRNSSYAHVLNKNLQVAGFYLPGRSSKNGRLLHTHITLVHNPNPTKDVDILYKVLPDASSSKAVNTYHDPEYMTIMLHTMGEFLGEKSSTSWNYAGVNSKEENVVCIKLQDIDKEFWDEMDNTSYQLLNILADGSKIEYQQLDGSWSQSKPSTLRAEGFVHEAGTLWMGDDRKTSVTDFRGKMHDFGNLYAVGSMIFPRTGSFNPTLTGIAQCFALASHLAEK
jgi:hypothetical protein